jgi:hypothetical protein
MPHVSRPHWLALMLLAALTACSTSTVRTTQTTPIIAGDPATPEGQLLDVGIRLFDPNVEALAEDEVFTAPEIRKAEARYFPKLLADTLQGSGHWGAVRVAPAETGISDIMVDGRIIESTGEKLELEVSVADASGAHWYTRRYEGLASKYSYENTRAGEPFQDVYNRIANDLALARAKLSGADAARLRTISELRFAEGFAPQAFGGFLATDRKGIYTIRRLPAENDPMLARIRQIRERDHLFIDTLQDYYANFSRQMAGPYQDWRKESYTESLAYRELRKQATMRTAAGIAAVVAGIAMQGGDSATTRAAGTVGILGGAAMVKSGFDKRAESKMHAETLQELGGSLGAEIDPQVIELDDRSVTLTGTVQDQYGQWREILHGIYATETGSI